MSPNLRPHMFLISISLLPLQHYIHDHPPHSSSYRGHIGHFHTRWITHFQYTHNALCNWIVLCEASKSTCKELLKGIESGFKVHYSVFMKASIDFPPFPALQPFGSKSVIMNMFWQFVKPRYAQPVLPRVIPSHRSLHLYSRCFALVSTAFCSQHRLFKDSLIFLKKISPFLRQSSHAVLVLKSIPGGKLWDTSRMRFHKSTCLHTCRPKRLQFIAHFRN